MSYFESRLKIDCDDFEDIRNKLELCDILGIKNLILEPMHHQRVSPSLKEQIKNSCKSNIYYRYNLKQNNLNQFKKDLNKFNNKYEILSVETSNKDIQIYAAKDSRIDIISFSDFELIKTLTAGILSLVKQNNSFIEFSLNSIMTSEKSIQSKNFRILYRYIHMVRKSKANLIISGNPVNIFDIRHPRALISICHTLLEIPLQEAKKFFNINPSNLLKRVEGSKYG